jgi:hypothetical protein
MDLTKIEKSQKVIDISKQVILVYGRAKIGKSTFCSQFDKPLFLATEPGLNNLEVHKVNVNSWEVFLDACKSIAESKHEFKTIVIDTIDNLVTFCSAYICNQHDINHPADLPHGKGWNFVTAELTRVISKLSMLGYGIIFTSHCELEEIETKTKKYNRWTISLSGKNRGLFLNLADIILFIDSEIDRDGNERRLIRTKPSMYWEAGDRLAKLPDTLPLDFKEFSKYFNQQKGG